MSRLGRGLDSLLGENPPTSLDNNETKQLAIESLFPGKFQPRRNFRQNELHTLADSVRRHGVIQPLWCGCKKTILGKSWRASGGGGRQKLPD